MYPTKRREDFNGASITPMGSFRYALRPDGTKVLQQLHSHGGWRFWMDVPITDSEFFE